MRISLSFKFALLSALLLLVVAGATTYVLVHEFGTARRRDLIAHDRELARMLAALRSPSGKVDFGTLRDFVGTADTVDLGLVYALELDDAQNVSEGALNPHLFAQIDPAYRKQLKRGSGEVMAALARGSIARQGRIKEYSFRVTGGQLRLGFDIHRIDRQIARQTQIGLSILALGLCLGVIAAVLVARSTTRPIRALAQAMEAVTSGNMNQTVEVHSHDELASLAGSFNRMMRYLREVKSVQELATGYLSAEVIDRALNVDGGDPRLLVEERAVTVLTVDIRQARRLGWMSTAPRELLSRLNEHLDPLLSAILGHDGTVIAVEQTRVQAVWGMPKDEPKAEFKALMAAAELRDRFERESALAEAGGITAPCVAMGVSTGRAAAGNIGSLRRYSFTVVGEPVDHALAIAAMARPGEIWLSEATYTKVSERAVVRVCPPLMLEGMDEPLPLYRLVTIEASS